MQGWLSRKGKSTAGSMEWLLKHPGKLITESPTQTFTEGGGGYPFFVGGKKRPKKAPKKTSERGYFEDFSTRGAEKMPSTRGCPDIRFSERWEKKKKSLAHNWGETT